MQIFHAIAILVIVSFSLPTAEGQVEESADPKASGGFAPGSTLEWAWWTVSEALETLNPKAPPIPVPPVSVKWRPTRVSVLPDVQTILDLGFFDFDGDGTHEVLALLPREVLWLSYDSSGQFRVASRLKLQGAPSQLASRIPVGNIRTRSEGVWVQTSQFENEFKIVKTGDGLALGSETKPAPRCGMVVPVRVQGTHLISQSDSLWLSAGSGAAVDGDLWTLECFSLGGGAREHALSGAAWTTHQGLVGLRCRNFTKDCYLDAMDLESLGTIGHALALGDLGRDGWLHIATTKRSESSMRDRVTLWTTAEGRLVKRFSRSFAQGVHELSIGDSDGDQVEELFASTATPKGVEIWRLTR